MPSHPARPQPVIVGLVGQPNSGKSTLFNALTGLRQHIANYPGVTVEKKTGRLDRHGRRIELVDLPGSYSLSAFSPEERVVSQFLLQESPQAVINVLDATQLRRGLMLTLQLLEMGLPLIAVLNMSDVAQRNQQPVNTGRLSAALGAPVVSTIGRRGQGLEPLTQTLDDVLDGRVRIATRLPDYGPLEGPLATVLEALPEKLRSRWLGLHLLEGESDARALIGPYLSAEELEHTLTVAARERADFTQRQGISVADHIVGTRNRQAHEIESACVPAGTPGRISLSERVDRAVLNRWLAPVFLLATVYAIYHTSIVQGYELTHYTWPLLAGMRNLAAEWLPAAGFLYDPLTRSMALWLIDSVNTLLNYVPIFLILFALIAILEDSGYMARIAFILDRILHRFGLHGQSTLPFVLGGVFAGGCAVPGVMATKAIPDPRARLATILTVPYMNCLAKVPLYTLLIGIFFVDHKGLMLFFIATITVMVALLVARLLTASVLR
ncbi:MAG: ferrous iron transport protein B, partial [Gammaproteobacteria bacterium]